MSNKILLPSTEDSTSTSEEVKVVTYKTKLDKSIIADPKYVNMTLSNKREIEGVYSEFLGLRGIPANSFPLIVLVHVFTMNKLHKRQATSPGDSSHFRAPLSSACKRC